MVIGAALATAGTKLGLAAKGFLIKNGDKILNGLGSIGKLGNMFGSGSAKKAAEQQYQYNLALQKQAQRWNEKMYKHRYQWQVEDLESAGINKLYGLGTAPMTSSGTNSVGMADYVGEQNNKFQQFMSALDFGATLSAKRAQGKLLENQANTEAINTNLKTIEVEEKNILNMMNRIKLKFLPEREKAEIQESITRSKKNITSAQKDISDIQTQQINSKQTERINEFYEKYPKIGKFITGLGQTREALFAGLAIGGGGVAMATKAKVKNNSARRVRRR